MHVGCVFSSSGDSSVGKLREKKKSTQFFQKLTAFLLSDPRRCLAVVRSNIGHNCFFFSEDALEKGRTRLKRGEELCGVIVYTYPPPGCAGRHIVLPGRRSMSELNVTLSTISRVVVHPKYRSIGLGAKLIRESMPLVGTLCVEMIAVMAKYNPFAEKAGMRKVLEQKTADEPKRLAETLCGFGFDLKLLGSEKHVLSTLNALSPSEIDVLREAFLRNDHPRFRREFPANRHVPYGTAGAYAKVVKNSDILKLARLVKIAGMLLQTKVYLFWTEIYSKKLLPQLGLVS